MSRVAGLMASVITAMALIACASGNGAGVPTTSYAAATQSIDRAQPEATNLIKNGSFETPVVPSGSYQVFSTGQTFSRWKVVGATGNVAIISGSFAQSGFTFPAKSGNQWIDLTGNSQTATGVNQTVATTINAKYNLVFWVGNVYDPSGIFGVSSTVNVLVNGHKIFSGKNSAKSTTLVWKKFSTTITATSSKTKIAFINADPSNDTSNALDAVKLFAE